MNNEDYTAFEAFFFKIYTGWHVIGKYVAETNNPHKKYNMKNLIVALCAGLLLTTAAEAQTKTKIKVKKAKTEARITAPDAVKSAFEAKYVTSDARWTKGYNGNYMITFTNVETVKQITEYDASGNLIRSKVVYNTDRIPENVRTALIASYADATVTEMTKLELAGVSPYYKIKLKQGENKKEILMSEEGTISE